MSLDLLQRAASFAARAHQHQLRKDGHTPYIAHPLRVALILQHTFHCHDHDAIAAALLHDTIEDCKVDHDDIHDQFGPSVAALVVALTKNMLLREEEREHDYDARLAAADWRARLIKLADTYDNYTDTAGISPAMKDRATKRAHRAINLASADAAAHPESARAIEALQALLHTP
jgi:guanosine-3',5'-bis(diphosphate) 3'-pyrophosphohydrolase